MTLLERREIYWEMYTVAVGLDTLMTSDEMRRYNFISPYPAFPKGMCMLCFELLFDKHNMLDYLPELKKPISNDDGFWWREYNWNIRSKELIKAIKRTYK
jgi:hypothetical protein